MPRQLKEARLHPEREIPAKQTSEDEAAQRLLEREPDLGENRGTPIGVDEDTGRIVFDTDLLEAAGVVPKQITVSGTFTSDPNANSLRASGHAVDVTQYGDQHTSHIHMSPPPMIVSPSVYRQLEARGVDTAGARQYEDARRRMSRLEDDIAARCGEVLNQQADLVMEAAKVQVPVADRRGYFDRIIG